MASRVLVALRVAATPERAFEAFTREIGQCWQPNQLFWFTDRSATGRLVFDPGPDGRLIERQRDGDVFEIGRVTAWEPPAHLAFEWRQASFAQDQFKEVHVKFEPAGGETRVTIEHYGWDAVPQEHAAPWFSARGHPAASGRVVAGPVTRLRRPGARPAPRAVALLCCRLAEMVIGAGDRLPITGPNGAGKTTLLRVLFGELRPDRGVVRRRGRIGYLPQEIPGTHSLGGTVRHLNCGGLVVFHLVV